MKASLPTAGRLAGALSTQARHHPRLLIRKTGLPALLKRARKDARYEQLVRKYLPALPPSTTGDARAHIKQEARRLIALAFVGLIDGPERPTALAAARGILARLASAETWNPRPVIRSFLDRAETAVAVAVGYDWLYEHLDAGERRAIEAALVCHILVPASDAYADPRSDWPDRRENYTLASAAGVALAALVVGDRHLHLAASVLEAALHSTANALDAFAPDGAWHEGPSYWALSVRSAALLAAALESVFGSSFGLADKPGFIATGQFALHVRGPTGDGFNFADSTTAFDTSALRWLAHRFGNVVDRWQAAQCAGWFLPFALIWDIEAGAGPAALHLPTGKIFRGCALACFRDSWVPEARPVFFAIKGGTTAWIGTEHGQAKLPLHTQADVGTFVVESGRRRWALDLGSDRYDLPGYFRLDDPSGGPNRWRYYRNSGAGHNTLTVAGREPEPAAVTPILSGGVGRDRKWVVLDLSAAYGSEPRAIVRGGALVGRSVILQDEIASGLSWGTRWRMHTSAEPVSVSARRLRLRQGRDELVISVLTPRRARLTVTEPPPPQEFMMTGDAMHGSPDHYPGGRVAELPRRDDAAGTRAAGAPLRRIDIEWPGRARRLTVLLEPRSSVGSIRRTLPLNRWSAGGPIGDMTEDRCPALREQRPRAPYKDVCR